MFRVAHAAHHGADGVVAVDERQAGHADRGIGKRLRERLRRRVHDAEHAPPQHQRRSAQRQRQQAEKGEHRADEPPHVARPPRAQVLRDDHLPGVGKAHRHEREKVAHVAADGHGRKPDLAERPADDDHVHHVVDDLQQIRQKQRQREDDELLHDAAASEIGNVRTAGH